jgi:hypothetical protein
MGSMRAEGLYPFMKILGRHSTRPEICREDIFLREGPKL